MGINVNGTLLNNLRFADDVILATRNTEKIKHMIEELTIKGREAGLNINLTKTKILEKCGNGNFSLPTNGEKIQKNCRNYIFRTNYKSTKQNKKRSRSYGGLRMEKILVAQKNI